MRKLATPLVMLVLAVVLMGAGVAASGSGNGAGPNTITQGQMTLKLTSTMPGVTFSGDTLVCPTLLITASSGQNLGCEFTISSTGAIQPEFVTVTMAASGISAAQVAAHKFAIEPNAGQLVYLETTSQTIYTFSGAALPATINPAVAWGANAGTALDNSDMGSSMVVTYTVVAESAEGATATPVPTNTPSQAVGGVTPTPGRITTAPPTASSSDSSGGNGSSPLFALLISFFLGALGVSAVAYQRRGVRR